MKDDGAMTTEWENEKKKNGREGMTLVEVVVALFIFALVTAGMMKLMSVVSESSDRAREHYQAVNICKNRIERARSFDFAQIHTFEEDKVLVDKNGQPADDANFRRTTVVNEIGTNLVEMIVTVEIRNRKTWEFDGVSEHVRSMLANMALPPDNE